MTLAYYMHCAKKGTIDYEIENNDIEIYFFYLFLYEKIIGESVVFSRNYALDRAKQKLQNIYPKQTTNEQDQESRLA